VAVATRKFDLTKDPQIEGFIKIAKAQQISEQKAEFERATPSKDKLQEMCKTAVSFGPPQYK
jgi:hypothetical protein